MCFSLCCDHTQHLHCIDGFDVESFSLWRCSWLDCTNYLGMRCFEARYSEDCESQVRYFVQQDFEFEKADHEYSD